MDLNIPILTSLNQLQLALACLSLAQLRPSLSQVKYKCRSIIRLFIQNCLVTCQKPACSVAIIFFHPAVIYLQFIQSCLVSGIVCI